MRLRGLSALVMACAITASAVLAGCGESNGTGENSQADVAGGTVAPKETAAATEAEKTGKKAMELTYWTLESRKPAAEPIVEEWNNTHDDVKIVLSIYSTDGIKDACKVGASSKTLPNMWHNWGGSLGGFYAENDLTYDLTEYARENNWDEKFFPNALELAKLGGQLCGYPINYKAMGIYYKKDIFERLNLQEPTSFEEFEQLCAVLKENGVTPISTGGLYGWHTMRFVELLIEHYAGPELHDKMNAFEESFDNEAVVKAFEKYQEFCEKGYFPEGFMTQDPNDTLINLATGQCAMDVQGPWYDGTILRNEQNPADYGVFAFPSGGTNRMSSFIEMTQFNAGNTKEELEACIEFMDFYHSQEHLNQYSSGFSLPLALTAIELAENQPNVPVMMDMAKQNGVFLITDQAFPTEVADVLFNAQDAMANGQMSPEEAAENIAAAIEEYKKK